MADTYWLSFRLADSGGWEKTYSDRLAKLNAEIKASCGNGSKWWFDTTAFFLFSSAESTDTIVARVKRAIAVQADLVVLGKTDYKVGCVIGNLKDKDIYTLVPFMKKV